MEKTYDIIIGGGGIIGSMMALALSDQGLKIALIDDNPISQKTELDFDGRAYALSLSTYKMLSSLKVWDDLHQSVQPILDIKVSDGLVGYGASPFHMHFDHKEMELGPIGYMVEDRFLRYALMERLLSNKTISTFFETKIVSQTVKPGCVKLDLENGATFVGKILIGSDGLKSTTAERSGIKRNFHNYGQTSLVCAVSHDREHLGEAHQFFMPAGPFAILPLINGRSSIVWTEKSGLADQIKLLSDKDFLKELKIRFGDFRGQVRLQGKRYVFPLSLSIAKTIVSKRVALIGDAAHALHPIAGQGLNLGMRDVASLAEVIIVAFRRGEDFGAQDVLARYASWREFDRVTLYGVTHTVNKLFSNHSLVLRALRGVGMTVINNIPTVRRSLMKEASGLGNDLPSLMMGKQI